MRTKTGMAIVAFGILVSSFPAEKVYSGPFDFFKAKSATLINPAILKLFPLQVKGTAGDDTIEFRVTGTDFSNYRIAASLNGTQVFTRPYDICQPPPSDDSTFELEEAPSFTLRAFGGGGNDTITVDLGAIAADCPCEINGGDGNDTMTIRGCKGGTIRGGNGDDTIEAGLFSRNLRIYGDGGDDTIDSGMATTFVHGGAGNDTFEGISRELVVGGAGSDTFHGAGDIAVCESTDSDVSIAYRVILTNVSGGCAEACNCTADSQIRPY